MYMTETERIKVLEETKCIAILEGSDITKRRIETEREFENRLCVIIHRMT